MSDLEVGRELLASADLRLLARLKDGTATRADIELALDIGYHAAQHTPNCRIWQITRDPFGDLFPDEHVAHCNCKPATRST